MAAMTWMSLALLAVGAQQLAAKHAPRKAEKGGKVESKAGLKAIKLPPGPPVTVPEVLPDGPFLQPPTQMTDLQFDEVANHQKVHYNKSWPKTPKMLCFVTGVEAFLPETGAVYRVQYVNKNKRQICDVDFAYAEKNQKGFRPKVTCNPNPHGTKNCIKWAYST